MVSSPRVDPLPTHRDQRFVDTCKRLSATRQLDRLPVRLLAARYGLSPAGKPLEQVERGLAAVEERAHVRLGPTEWLQGRHPLQRLAADVEDQAVPGCRGHLGRVA